MPPEFVEVLRRADFSKEESTEEGKEESKEESTETSKETSTEERKVRVPLRQCR